ncbi:MAG: type II toxin-antitoxin system HicB family antitoxin [Elusimicrobia bacterium]|nr:type II toxin-antitoxin system HicB family antitoxin [Elusimicrobiota bacterium]
MEHFKREVFYSKEDGGWIALAPELPGCSAFGETTEDALSELAVAIGLWLKTAKGEGREIPEPTAEKDTSGKFIVRLPKSMHRDLIDQALAEGVSLNQYVLYRLSGGPSRRRMAEAGSLLREGRRARPSKRKA